MRLSSCPPLSVWSSLAKILPLYFLWDIGVVAAGIFRGPRTNFLPWFICVHDFESYLFDRELSCDFEWIPVLLPLSDCQVVPLVKVIVKLFPLSKWLSSFHPPVIAPSSVSYKLAFWGLKSNKAGGLKMDSVLRIIQMRWWWTLLWTRQGCI